MKLVHPLLEEPIVFQENQIPVWVIENKTAFTSLITEIKQQIKNEQGQFVLSEEMDILPLNKYTELIIDPFHLQINNKQNLNKVYKRLEQASVTEELYQQTMIFRSKMYTYLEELLSTETLSFIYKDSFDICQLLKTIELQISYEGESLTETIQDYLRTLTEFHEIKLFVFVNLKCFLSEKDLAELFHFISYEKINILLLENHDQQSHNDNESIILFDEDLSRIL